MKHCLLTPSPTVPKCFYIGLRVVARVLRHGDVDGASFPSRRTVPGAAVAQAE